MVIQLGGLSLPAQESYEFFTLRYCNRKLPFYLFLLLCIPSIRYGLISPLSSALPLTSLLNPELDCIDI